MKKFGLLLLCLMFVVGANAQLTKGLVVNKAYVDSQSDTTATVSNMGLYNHVDLVFHSTDSAVVKINIDIRDAGVTAWTLKDSVTITSAANAGVYYDWQLKGPVVDKVTGITKQIRIRNTWSTNNGVTSPKFWETLYYR